MSKRIRNPRHRSLESLPASLFDHEDDEDTQVRRRQREYKQDELGEEMAEHALAELTGGNPDDPHVEPGRDPDSEPSDDYDR